MPATKITISFINKNFITKELDFHLSIIILDLEVRKMKKKNLIKIEGGKVSTRR